MGQFKCWNILKTWEIWVFAKGIQKRRVQGHWVLRSPGKTEGNTALQHTARGRSGQIEADPGEASLCSCILLLTLAPEEKPAAGWGSSNVH